MKIPALPWKTVRKACTIRFRPDKALKSSLVNIHAKQTKYANHSQKLSEVEIDMRLKEYFAENKVMTRRDFQRVCCMAQTTAKVHLQRLREEGDIVIQSLIGGTCLLFT